MAPQLSTSTATTNCLTDADTVEDHFQVDLEAGANTIKVKVTAEDTVTAVTYTLVVTRAVPMASADALLSNLDESNDAGLVVGKPADSPNARSTQAIRFQTGSNERGYNLTSVKAILANATDSDGVRVRIFNARSNGNPYYSLYTLTNPTISDGTLTFTAPASATLQNGTSYFAMFDSTGSGVGNDYEIRGTESESLNSQADGWSLNTDRHVAKTPESLFWRTHDEVPLVEISGDALARANDANLSALSIDDGDSRFRTSYSPHFDPSMTSYTSTAATLIDQITINATPANADGAEVAYLDGDGQLLTDADADTEGFQVDLEVGANTIGVRVTAENGTTTRTYTMVVTREESRVSANALASNLDEHFSKRLYVGNLEPGKTLRAQALGFETGANEAGYVLTSVKILIWEITHSAGTRVRIFSSTAEGDPDSSLYTLSGSVVLPTTDQPPEDDSPASTFEASANAVLESNTRYFVVIDSRSSQLYRFYKIWGTKSDVISKVADGWSMNNFRHTGIRDTGVWTTADEVPFVEVAGHAVVPSSDATLSALALSWDDGGTETDITLDPRFNASTTAYTAGVAHGVDRITIKETKGDSGATVIYLDGTDSTLTDAGHQRHGLSGRPRRRRQHDQGEGECQRRRDHPDLHAGGDAGGGRHDRANGERRDSERRDPGDRLQRGPRRRGKPLERRVHCEEDAVGGFGDDRGARRLTHDQRLRCNPHARDGRRVHRRGREGELHQAHHGHGQQTQGYERQRGRRLRGSSRDQRDSCDTHRLVPERAGRPRRLERIHARTGVLRGGVRRHRVARQEPGYPGRPPGVRRQRRGQTPGRPQRVRPVDTEDQAFRR